MLTPERLEAIKQRAEQAMPGPWRWAEWEEGAFGRPGRWVEPNPETPVGRLALLDREDRPVIEWDELDGIVVDEANREFIAHARTDLPALVAEVERWWAFRDRLRILLLRWRCEADGMPGLLQHCAGEIEALLAEMGLAGTEDGGERDQGEGIASC